MGKMRRTAALLPSSHLQQSAIQIYGLNDIACTNRQPIITKALGGWGALPFKSFAVQNQLRHLWCVMLTSRTGNTLSRITEVLLPGAR